MTNPRSSMVRQTPTATRPAALPALPPASTPFERTVAEILGVRAGAANPWERWTTRRDLQDLGLMGGLVVDGMPSDQHGLPVWIGRGRFQLVSIKALATALQEHLSVSAEGASAEDIAALRRRIASISTGAEGKDLNAAVQEGIDALRSQLLASITRLSGTDSLEERLTQLESRAATTAIQVERQGGQTVEISAPAAVWPITHELGYPQVTTLNAAGEVVLADVTYDSATQLTITHGRAMTGWVLLR